ncbi:hypothetical protein EC845_2517 [Comamonas sp. BIGb0124]|jgi:hypothetical protein|nr:hypothetical protein EC845_2517 [Comamonas sp. BIGb0124]
MPLTALIQAAKNKEATAARIGCLDELDRWVSTHGLRAGVMYLNSLVPYRCTALVRVYREVIYCTSAYDSQLELSGVDVPEVPLGASFSQYAIRDGSFYTDVGAHELTLRDEKLIGTVQSYMGVRMLKADGSLYGTLSHFDFAWVRPPTEHLAFLEAAALRLQKHVQPGGSADSAERG